MEGMERSKQRGDAMIDDSFLILVAVI